MLGTRFRLSTDSASGPDGLGVDGEFEDDPIQVFKALLPGYTIDKSLETSEPVCTGELISFTIRITNTGETALATVPL